MSPASPLVSLCDYDIVLTAYSILSVESSMLGTRARAAALMTPWEYCGSAGLEYTSPLGQVHWRRIVLDEGHSVKNAAAECSQQATKLLARCRYLMSGQEHTGATHQLVTSISRCASRWHSTMR